MSLTTSAQSSLGAAFDGDLVDAVSTLTYQQNNYIFDGATNKTQLTTLTYVSRGIVTRVKSSVVDDESYFDSTAKIIILQNELAITPEKNDKVIANGINYTIDGIGEDPAHVTWILKCRV